MLLKCIGPLVMFLDSKLSPSHKQNLTLDTPNNLSYHSIQSIPYATPYKIQKYANKGQNYYTIDMNTV